MMYLPASRVQEVNVTWKKSALLYWFAYVLDYELESTFSHLENETCSVVTRLIQSTGMKYLFSPRLFNICFDTYNYDALGGVNSLVLSHLLNKRTLIQPHNRHVLPFLIAP